MNLIQNIAKDYLNLPKAGVSVNIAYGVVLNNTTVGGIRLQDHKNGKRIAGKVLLHLGYKSEGSVVEGNLDSF